MYLATQFFFEAESLKKWEIHLNKLNNNLEIHAGIPGPATLKTLLGYARSCGIGNSIRFLSKQALNITKLATARSPDKLIHDLASYQIENPNTKLKKIHFYAFGGIKKTSDWLKSIDKPNLIYNGEMFE
jgi:methylenetetrahydrofolate reductase (NADPH)